jgi:hypothetical protein
MRSAPKDLRRNALEAVVQRSKDEATRNKASAEIKKLN